MKQKPGTLVARGGDVLDPLISSRSAIMVAIMVTGGVDSPTSPWALASLPSLE